MSHSHRIRDQFTRQAVAFSNAPAMADRRAIDLLVDAVGITRSDRVLDAACGPGLVALALAAAGARVTAVDATPAMLERARQIEDQRGLGPVDWRVADVMALPFPDARFDASVCRFAIHHLLEPARAVAEMRRVTRRGGRVVVCDGVASDDPVRADAFNQMERLRDPSTVSFLTEQGLVDLVEAADVRLLEVRRYRVPVDVDGLMAASFPDRGQERVVRQMLEDSVYGNALGMGSGRDGHRIVLHYPACVVVGEAPV